jgi:hypothetical protein
VIFLNHNHFTQMKKTLLTLAFAFAMYSQEATAQIQTPQPSPAATVQQVVGITNFTVTYSRPGLKGRAAFGNVVPFDQVWRTGANASTFISFDDKVKIEGNEIPAGKYALFSIPGKDEWTIIINKSTTGSSELDATQDLIRFKVKPQTLNMAVETFTIGFSEFTTNSANLDLCWDKTLVRMKVTTEPDTKIMEQIKKAMANPLASAAQNYFQSASYYNDNNKDLNQALEWINKAVEIRKDAFWMTKVKAEILAKLGKHKEAIETAEMSKKVAADSKNDAYVKMNDDNIAAWKKMVK